MVTTAKNARKIIEELKMDPKAYDYVEFMACPGGCLGGGGQPKPTSRRIVKQRIESVYRLDSQKQLRLAHQNLQATDFLDYSKQRGEDRFHQLLHRGYNRKKRFE